MSEFWDEVGQEFDPFGEEATPRPFRPGDLHPLFRRPGLKPARDPRALFPYWSPPVLVRAGGVEGLLVLDGWKRLRSLLAAGGWEELDGLVVELPASEWAAHMVAKGLLRGTQEAEAALALAEAIVPDRESIFVALRGLGWDPGSLFSPLEVQERPSPLLEEMGKLMRQVRTRVRGRDFPPEVEEELKSILEQLRRLLERLGR